jgi:hypothetical protein
MSELLPIFTQDDNSEIRFVNLTQLSNFLGYSDISECIKIEHLMYERDYVSVGYGPHIPIKKAYNILYSHFKTAQTDSLWENNLKDALEHLKSYKH